MKVEKNIWRVYPVEYLVNFRKRIVKLIHVDSAHEIHDRNRIRSHIESAGAPADTAALRIVCRTDNIILLKDIKIVFSAESVVSRCDDISARPDELLCGRAAYAVALSRILAVYDGNIHSVMLFYHAKLC